MKGRIVILILFFALIISCSKDDEDGMTIGGNPVANNQKALGTSSHDLLSDDTFKSIVIEVAYVQGYEPSAAAINHFVAFLNERVNKPLGIDVVKRPIASPGKTTFTNEDIVAIENANRTKYNTSDQIAVWAFFVDGDSSSNSGNSYVLGVSYRNTSFVIFEKTIQGLSNSPFEPNRSLLETTVIEHEFGHILGLTNLGAKMQSNHEDTAHPKHCNVESCLMYWLSESGNSFGNMVSGGTVPKLDAQCIADLRANGGK
ncbi:zinc metalloprotease [Flavobacterium gilvum]|uniref:Membrane metalloprotease n=1 Tax=Flavobacterium gilvum TaxID=1492737 RepID=A0AAC9N791_9FLAO|nr:membrane metalloprotease [Flavobacterium gilvum]AOW10048.1 membrane metalloprotease [Flavobacterium gilvum]KFC58664.1 hypothetical protein FEM08_25270 [Flavobacterium gilvum]